MKLLARRRRMFGEFMVSALRGGVDRGKTGGERRRGDADIKTMLVQPQGHHARLESSGVASGQAAKRERHGDNAAVVCQQMQSYTGPKK